MEEVEKAVKESSQEMMCMAAKCEKISSNDRVCENGTRLKKKNEILG